MKDEGTLNKSGPEPRLSIRKYRSTRFWCLYLWTETRGEELLCSLLLDTILLEADSSGVREVREVRGSIIRMDIEATPYLLDWYRSRVFEVSDPDSECIDIAVKMISRINDS